MIKGILGILECVFAPPDLSPLYDVSARELRQFEKEWQKILEERTQREVKQIYFLIQPNDVVTRLGVEFSKREAARYSRAYYSLRVQLLEIDGELVKQDNELFKEWHDETPIEDEIKNLFLELLQRFNVSGELKILPEQVAEKLMSTNQLVKSSFSTSERRTIC